MSLILSFSKNQPASLFLTSFDPSDLPGSSIDPLGFERGYLFLADKILPGLTNVANQPRYFSMLCAGASLAETSLSDPPRVQYEKRLETVLRMERFWALANVLAEREYVDEELPTGGIRGVSYARKQAEFVENRRIKNLDARFELLSRQTPYGVIGIYASNADGMQLLDRKTLRLTPDLGEEIAKDFIRSTGCSNKLKRAIREDRKVTRAELTEWGLNSHISNSLSKTEKAVVFEAVHRNSIRSRMLNLIQDAELEAEESEQDCFTQLKKTLIGSTGNRDLLEAIQTILDYESCYQIVSLGFERVLWLCRNGASASIGTTGIENDPVLKDVCELLPAATARFRRSLDQGETELFQKDLNRLHDVRVFLEKTAISSS